MKEQGKRLHRAVFLDRDGTINVEKEYLICKKDFEFIPGAPEALKKLQLAGFRLVIVTNQSGVARGYFSLAQVHALHQYIVAQLEQFGVFLAGIYVCPHHPTSGQGEYLCDCDCRKGKPGMLLHAAKELDIDLTNSFMIGDKLTDIWAGCAAGCCSYLVRTGYGSDFEATALTYGAKVADDLSAAAEMIVGDKNNYFPFTLPLVSLP